ncbi:hypothetical protein GGR51DRAFT_223637 [Nemania sp. FL0031]|nr:hypothetical protein GGR51DRAFT_223637 [Nemania sp. FL0031]
MQHDEQEYRDDCCMYSHTEGFPPEPQVPELTRSGAFSYNDQNGLRAGGFTRASLEDLRLLFRKNASSARRAIATKSWLTAQLRLYDIPFEKSAFVDELWSTLEAAVKGRKCVEGGPPSVATIKERLVARLAQRRKDYAQAVEKHKLDVREWHKQNFAALNDPSAEARYDLGLFFSKYFVDDKGFPDPGKTPEPVILWDLRDWSEPLRRRVEAIPGLSALVTSQITVIAWDPKLDRGIETAFTMIDRPDIKCDHLTLEAAFDPDRFIAKYFLDGLHGEPDFGKQKSPLTLKHWVSHDGGFEKLVQAAKHAPELLVQKTKEPIQSAPWGCGDPCVIVGWAKQVILQVEDWESEIKELELLEAKREKRDKEKAILAKVKPHIDYARAHRAPPSDESPLNRLAGSYIMHCRHLQDEYRCDLGSMTLDVHRPTSTHGAIAAFDFGLIEGTMLLATSEESLERLREEQAVRSSDDEEEFSCGYDVAALGKRRATGSQQANGRNFKRRLGGDKPAEPGRIYLQWAGCQTGDTYLVLDEDHERTGHFDLDKTELTARGQFYFRHFFGDEPLVFTLLKVSDTPKKRPDAWASYCEEDRWIRW